MLIESPSFRETDRGAVDHRTHPDVVTGRARPVDLLLQKEIEDSRGITVGAIVDES